MIAGYDQCHDLWVPVSYQQMRVYGPLPQRIVSWVRNHGDNRAEGSIATFDITITDETGRVLVEIREFSIKRLAKSDSFALDAKPSLHEVELEANDTAHDRQPSAGDEVFAHNLSQGITPIEGVAALERVLRGGISPQVIVSSLDVPALITQTDRLVASQEREQTTFTRPKLESEFLAPRDDVERTLAGIWQELLGVNEVGIHDNFFRARRTFAHCGAVVCPDQEDVCGRLPDVDLVRSSDHRRLCRVDPRVGPTSCSHR